MKPLQPSFYTQQELYILANPEKLLRYQATQCCTVTSDAGLMGRAAPTTKSNVVASFPKNTTICFSEVVEGEQVNNVWCWGYASLGGGLTFYFWMGGTNWGGTC